MKLTSDNETLAENKVLILYILNKIDTPVSNNELLQLVLSIEDMNYFYFQQFILDLLENKYIEEYIWSNISQPILPEKQRANVTINSNGIENKWLLDQADILTNYRLLKEIYYKPELDQWGNTTSDVSMAKGIICITQNMRFIANFDNV